MEGRVGDGWMDGWINGERRGRRGGREAGWDADQRSPLTGLLLDRLQPFDWAFVSPWLLGCWAPASRARGECWLEGRGRVGAGVALGGESGCVLVVWGARASRQWDNRGIPAHVCVGRHPARWLGSWPLGKGAE